jgi:beta-mannosidase
MFGGIDDVAGLLRATQFTQADGLRYAVEANRRRKYENSGSLPWQFNEPYPMAACTSAVDFHAIPKPVYYAVARAYAPITVSARYDRQAWADHTHFYADLWANDSVVGPGRPVHITARLLDDAGLGHGAVEFAATMAGNAATQLGSVYWPLGGINANVFFLDIVLRDGMGVDLAANRYVFSRTADLRPVLTVAPTRLDADLNRSEDYWDVEVTNAGQYTAMFVWLEDDLPLADAGRPYFEDNHFCLFPGEVRQVRVSWHGVPDPQRRINLAAWNTEILRLE